MGILDSILGSVLGGAGASSPMGSILSSILGGGGGLGGLLQQLGRAGHGETANSWVGNGPNQSIDPGALGDALGRDRVSQWSRETGMGENDILHQLSNLLPSAVNHMTPEGRMPEQASQSPAWGGQGSSSAPNPFQESPESDPFAGPGLGTGPR